MLFHTLSMWLAHYAFPIFLWIKEPFNLIGIVILTLSLLPAAGALRVMSGVNTTADPRSPEQTRVLITSGIFRFTRNPMYLSLLLVLVGQAVYLGSLNSLLFPAIFILTMNRYQIRREEKALEKLFGNEYLNYKKRVRRWI